MLNFIISLIILTALLLILTTIFQNSKKEGGGNTLGMMGAHQIIGVQRTTDLLERATWILLIILFTLSLSTFALIKGNHTLQKSPNLEMIQQKNLFLDSIEDGRAKSASNIPDNSKADDPKSK